MAEDYLVKHRSLEECERIADYWRAKFGLTTELVPDTLNILETRVRSLPGMRDFAIVPRDVGHMGGRKAYAAPKSKRIFVSEPLLAGLKQKDGHSRVVLGHEWFHLLHHPGDPKPWMINGNLTHDWITEGRSAEDQATNFSLAFHMPVQIVRSFKSAGELAAACNMDMSDAEERFEQVARRFAKRKVPEEFHAVRAQLRDIGKKGTKRFLAVPCEQCRERTLTPLGCRFLCDTCGHVCDVSEDTG